MSESVSIEKARGLRQGAPPSGLLLVVLLAYCQAFLRQFSGGCAVLLSKNAPVILELRVQDEAQSHSQPCQNDKEKRLQMEQHQKDRS